METSRLHYHHVRLTLYLSTVICALLPSVAVAEYAGNKTTVFQVSSTSTSQGGSCFLKGNAVLYCKLGGAGGGRGFNIAVFYPGTDILRDAVNFDTWGDGDNAAPKLVSFLEAIPQGSLVLVSIGDEAGLRNWQQNYAYFPYAESIMRTLEASGSKQIRDYYYNDAWCLAAIKGTGIALKESFAKAPAGSSAFTSTEIEITAQIAAEERIVGTSYGPFRDGQSPNLGIFPTLAQMQADMPLLKRMGNVIRTYSVTNNFDQIIGFAKQAGMKAIPTAWIGTDSAVNSAEETKLISIAPQYDNIPFVIVGNEAIKSGSQPATNVIAAINRVKQAITLPVTTVETWDVWAANPALADATGIICMNVYGYWDNQPIESAVDYVVRRYNEMKARYPSKRVIISETGWPTAGEVQGSAVPSVANQRRFWQEFLLRAKAENIDFLAFAAFDEAWKRSSGKEAEAHWGLYTSARQPKHDVISVNLTAATVSAASYLPDAAVARESIVSAFGNSFGSSPTVKVTSATQESPAFVFYAGPTQINYQIPPGISTGIATVTITGNDGSVSMGLTKIVDVMPGIFTASADGKGIAAAKVQRIKAGGAVSYEEMVQTIQGQNVAIPIDLGPETDQVFLNLFGTGIRFRSSAVTAQIGGTNAEVTFADAQGQFIGLDQINVRIPRSLQGRGDVDVIVMVDNQRANTVRINIK